jgi:hypothetical protein
MGELVKAIAYLVRVRELTHGQLAQAHVAASSIPESGWTGDDVEAHRAYLTRVSALATPHSVGGVMVGDGRCAAHFETKAGKVGEVHEIREQAAKEYVFQQDQERKAYGLDREPCPCWDDDSDDMTPEATFETMEATSPDGVTPNEG